MFDLLIRNCRIVDGSHQPYLGSVAVTGEKISAILPPNTDSRGRDDN